MGCKAPWATLDNASVGLVLCCQAEDAKGDIFAKGLPFVNGFGSEDFAEEGRPVWVTTSTLERAVLDRVLLYLLPLTSLHGFVHHLP